MNELISIVVPVYKVEPYLERCIRSITAQTYDNLEIILVDDGSPDQCGAICDRFAQDDPRIKVYHKKNGGTSDARNYGVERASGKYISFVDADDYLSTNYFAYLSDLLVKHDADISCCCMERTSEDTSAFGINPGIPKERLFTGREACREFFGCCYDVLVTVWGKLFKSEIVKQFSFPVGRRYEDEAVVCKYYYAANWVVIGNRCLYAYYQNPDSFMHCQTTSINPDAVWAFGHRAAFFEEHHERRLAELAWNFQLNYLIRHSLANQGTYDQMIHGFEVGKSLDLKTKIAVRLYTMSPYIYQKCLKAYSMLLHAMIAVRNKVRFAEER